MLLRLQAIVRIVAISAMIAGRVDYEIHYDHNYHIFVSNYLVAYIFPGVYYTRLFECMHILMGLPLPTVDSDSD